MSWTPNEKIEVTLLGIIDPRESLNNVTYYSRDCLWWGQGCQPNHRTFTSRPHGTSKASWTAQTPAITIRKLSLRALEGPTLTSTQSLWLHTLYHKAKSARTHGNKQVWSQHGSVSVVKQEVRSSQKNVTSPRKSVVFLQRNAFQLNVYDSLPINYKHHNLDEARSHSWWEGKELGVQSRNMTTCQANLIASAYSWAMP